MKKCKANRCQCEAEPDSDYCFDHGMLEDDDEFLRREWGMDD